MPASFSRWPTTVLQALSTAPLPMNQPSGEEAWNGPPRMPPPEGARMTSGSLIPDRQWVAGGRDYDSVDDGGVSGGLCDER